MISVALTPSNPDDRKPISHLVWLFIGKLFANKGFILAALTREFSETIDLQLITPLKRHMKNRLLPIVDKLLLRKRAVIGSLIDQLMNIWQIELSLVASPTSS